MSVTEAGLQLAPLPLGCVDCQQSQNLSEVLSKSHKIYLDFSARCNRLRRGRENLGQRSNIAHQRFAGDVIELNFVQRLFDESDQFHQ